MDVLFNAYVWVFYLSGHKQLRAICEIIYLSLSLSLSLWKIKRAQMTVNYDASWSFNLDQNYWENWNYISSILGCMKNGLESFFLVIIIIITSD